MNSKKGFVLLETVIVLIVAVVAMLGLFLTYSFVFKNLKQGSHYDNAIDLYRLNVFYNTMKSNGFPNDDILVIYANAGTTDNIVKNCTEYFDSNCVDLMSKLDINYFIYLNSNTDDILLNENIKSKLKNTDINYIKKLDNHKSYLVSVYRNYINGCNGDDCPYYYVSLQVGDSR